MKFKIKKREKPLFYSKEAKDAWEEFKWVLFNELSPILESIVSFLNKIFKRIARFWSKYSHS